MLLSGYVKEPQMSIKHRMEFQPSGTYRDVLLAAEAEFICKAAKHNLLGLSGEDHD